MEILQLQYFYDTAQTEKISATAEKYGVPTSSVSASIKRLEQELGTKLFERTSNRIALNEAGKKLMRHVGSILEEMAGITDSFQIPNVQNTRIRILVRSLRNRVTGAIIAFREQFPGVRFVTDFGFGDENIGDYDLIVDVQTDRYGNYRRAELFSLRVLIKAAQNHPFAGKKVTLSQLRKEAFVTMDEGSSLHSTLVEACKNAGFVPDIVVQTNDAHCYDRCIAEGVGIGPTRAGKLHREDVCFLDVEDFQERQNFYCYFPTEPKNPMINEFVRFLKAMM